MTRSIISYDSADWRNIPRDAAAVMPYHDGRYAYSHTLFPHARYRYISVLGNWEKASIFDIEPGCIWPPANARDAVRNRQNKYGDACVYCFRAAVPLVRQALKGLRYQAILSTLDGSRPRRYDEWELSGVQYKGGPTAAYDETEIFDENFLRKP